MIVIGGFEKEISNKEEWHRYEAARLFRIDTETEQVADTKDYISPPAVCPDHEPSILFKSGTLDGSHLYLCTQTEVLILDAADFSIERVWTHPWLNDVHHVLPDGEGGFYVVVTGLDLVLRVNAAGTVVGEWSAVPREPPFARFDRSTDYRKVATTKPHQVHPNFAFWMDGDLWVTRFHPRDALCLTAARAPLPVEVEGPHDGNVFAGKVYFTTVDGHIVVIDPADPAARQVYDLNTFGRFDAPLGWCRGLKILDEHRVVVGFSRIRRTRFSENLRWLRKRVAAIQGEGSVDIPPAPTGIRCFNLKTRTQEYAIDLERHGMNAIFSVL